MGVFVFRVQLDGHAVLGNGLGKAPFLEQLAAEVLVKSGLFAGAEGVEVGGKNRLFLAGIVRSGSGKLARQGRSGTGLRRRFRRWQR